MAAASVWCPNSKRVCVLEDLRKDGTVLKLGALQIGMPDDKSATSRAIWVQYDSSVAVMGPHK